MQGFKRANKRNIFFPGIDLPALLAIILFAVLIFFYLIPGFEKAIMERKRTLIHEMTSSACSILEYFHEAESKGLMDPENARQQAKMAIGTIRYGDSLKDYFWITDMHPRMIMHPYRPDLNGNDLTDFRDQDGKTIFVDFVKAARPTGESYVEYMWQWNDDSTRVVPKLSYVRIFKPWGWVVGTGIYIDDVRAEIRKTEFRAMMISGIIGLIITVILLTISRQSHHIELKRSRAEEELRKSRELYRTLAEAASEGVLIWSSQGIRANKTLLSWTGHTEEDLLRIAPFQLFDCTITKEYDNPSLLYSELSSRRFCEGILITSQGGIVKSHADFSRIILGDQQAVLIVIRPAKDVIPVTGFSPEKRLLSDISTGFFRVTFGRRNKFITATDRTMRMLGFNDMEALIQSDIEKIFASPDILNEVRISLASGKDIRDRQVSLRRKNGEEFRALISVMVVESDSQGTYCEGSVEELSVSSTPDIPVFPDIASYSSAYISQAPVSVIMKPATMCSWDTPVSSCLSMMKNNNTSVLMVTDKNNVAVGILDLSDTAISLAEGRPGEVRAADLMHSPLLLTDKDSKVSEALSMLSDTSVKAIAVTDPGKQICGIVTCGELISVFSNTPELILSSISKASSGKELSGCYNNCRRLAVAMILGHAGPAPAGLYLASVADAITIRAIELSLMETGEPPCRFAFIHTGSAGRKEQTLLTDQDNAIIFEDAGNIAFEKNSAYFTSLGKEINEILDISGYRLCPGKNMAGNPEWCQPLSVWKKYFSRWINEPGPDEILKTSVFFDFRYCYGDRNLVEELRNHVRNHLSTSDIYFHHVSLAWKQFAPSASSVTREKTNVKKLVMPLTGIVRLYALKYAIAGLSTYDRIIELYSAGHLDVDLLRDVLKAWKDLTMIRFYQQASSISEGKEPDNLIDLNMAEHEFRSFVINAITAINDLMLKAGTDFYTEII
ncbi:MAG TPA: DUF294 nucleotidyltransferase-like domain-containing protein [Bacteroidales bacterium]|nr:DUF294 nucleotidyltransferase-like domain-containing protein [Bacteroidales bacterium]